MPKKKKNEIVEDLKFPLMFAGGAIGASVLGGAIEPHIPHGMTNPLTTTGRVMGRFTGPVAAISAGGIVFKQFKKTRKKLKGGI